MIKLDMVSKRYRTGSGDVAALEEVSMQVTEGEFIVVRGPSGSGKTTLLLVTGGMLRVSSGSVFVNGEDVYRLPEGQRARFRAENIGFVFQMFHLIPYLNVLENVLLPAGAGNRDRDRTVALELLERFRLSERASHKPSELSAGESQRTAIARAMFGRPRLILADEPTGNLDPENAEEVIKYLAEYHLEGGTVIVVTHGRVVDQYADRIMSLQNGRIVKEELR
jgi:ABC-type lipoprotein export system ATPase subunit